MRGQKSLPSALKRQPYADYLSDYLEGKEPQLDKELIAEALRSKTPFTGKVLDAIVDIPFGQTITYAQLAQRIGCPRHVRAVANALSRNDLPILIPCHRVIATSGIGGYAFGVDLKIALFDYEKGLITKTMLAEMLQSRFEHNS